MVQEAKFVRDDVFIVSFGPSCFTVAARKKERRWWDAIATEVRSCSSRFLIGAEFLKYLSLEQTLQWMG